MHLQEVYLLIFIDTFYNTLFFMPENKLFLESAILFKKIPSIHLWLITTIASFLGHIINYYIGRLLRYAIIVKGEVKQIDKKFNSFFLQFDIVLGILNWVPVIGPVLIVLAGYARMKLIKILPSLLLGCLVFYYFLIIK
jgi:membrane protein YqaA with SNARE-associated domain